ncbi:MAG: hypothetical protein SPJ59_01640 [Peptoniphilaceae bacterium]|nr:hypothetical protein [Peptoniphilaceae bacterium]
MGYNVHVRYKKGGKRVRKDKKKKPDERLIQLAMITAIISLVEKLVELLIKLLEIIRG